MDAIRYVTFDEGGNLTGCYLQEVHPTHAAAYLPCEDWMVLDWPNWRVNMGTMTLERIPEAPPGPFDGETPWLGSEELPEEALVDEPETNAS